MKVTLVIIFLTLILSCTTQRIQKNMNKTFTELVSEINAQISEQNKLDYLTNLTDKQIAIKSNAGQNLFHEFINDSNLNILKALLNRGLDINNHSTWDGQTILFKTENIEVIQWLLKNGANINHQDNDGYTPISYIYDNTDLLEIYLENKAKTSIRTKSDDYLLKMIIINIHDDEIVEKLKLFRLYNVDLDETGSNGMNMMHLAILWQKPKAVEYLLNNCYNCQSKTTIDFKFLKGEEEILLSKESSPLDLSEKLIDWVITAKDFVGGEWVQEQMYEVYTCYYILKEKLSFLESEKKVKKMLNW